MHPSTALEPADRAGTSQTDLVPPLSHRGECIRNRGLQRRSVLRQDSPEQNAGVEQDGGRLDTEYFARSCA
jgi:hypothetical protein